jgi:hypothetical protein
MTLNTWTDTLVNSFNEVATGVFTVIPNLIIALILVILGWIVGAAVSKIIEQIFKSVKVDKALASAGLEELVDKTGFKLNSGRFIGEVVKWFVIVVFLITSLEVLGLYQVNIFLTEVAIGFIPNVIAAVLILFIAVIISDALRKTVIASAKAAGVHSANFLGAITKWSIWIFALLAALFQLGIGAVFIQTLFTGVIVALALAFGLAFGLGGRDAAANVVDKMKKEISNHRE